jgi:hypothetical protein
MYAPNSQSTKALMALHESAKHADPKISGAAVDTHAAAPIACFTYTQGLGMQIVTVHLAYTKPPEKPKKWLDYWKESGFASPWRLWSTKPNTDIRGDRDERHLSRRPKMVLRYYDHQDRFAHDVGCACRSREAIASLRNVKGC